MGAPLAESLSTQTISTRPKVLLVDDQKAFTDLFKTLLEEGLQLATTAFNDPREALAALLPGGAIARPESQPSLVISDLVMPGMDGFQFLREVAEILPGVPSILVTGGRPEPARVQASQPPHFLGVLYKPISWRELAHLLREHDVIS